MRSFLSELRESLPPDREDLFRLFDTFANEAIVAREWLSPSLDKLPKESKVLEVGAGLMLLSCQLEREGFCATALEPIGSGFSIFLELQNHVRLVATQNGFCPNILSIPVEELDIHDKFHFAFSFNVMEHVENVEQAITRVYASLAPGSEYRFYCPNYIFPYEPHFNIPTLFSKNLTYRAFKNLILSRKIADPRGLWDSLNWINVFKVRRIARRLLAAQISFNPDALFAILERSVRDKEFAARRSSLMVSLIRTSVAYKLHHIFKLTPLYLQPVMDCRVRKVPARSKLEDS